MPRDKVLTKACKAIPVMIMGKFVQGKTYAWETYAVQVAMAGGLAIFLFGKAEEDGKARSDDSQTSIAGVVMLVGYMAFDSFTSNYQSGLFGEWKMSKFQMMMGINMFSCFFSLWALITRGKLLPSLAFLVAHPTFMFHGLLLSVTSATGQIFIFHTISTYGPLVFTVIMTTRQVMSIFLSAFFYGHHFPWKAWCGIAIAITALGTDVILRWRAKKNDSTKSSGPR